MTPVKRKKALPDPDKLLSHPAALCNILRRIAIAAGDITLEYFEGLRDMEVETKSDSSPVTLADRAAEEYIETQLLEILPHVPIIGEEAVSAGDQGEIQNEEWFFLVDPLDGTKEFISGSGEFTVNIALIRNEEPCMGVVYAPAKGELYAGYERTALRWTQDSQKDKDIHVRPIPAAGLTVVASKSHGDPEKLDRFLEGFKVNKLIKRGSSLKICAIAAGKADLYPRFGPTCEWDTAAAHAVLSAAGGILTDTKGRPLKYGQGRPGYLNPEFIAGSFEWFAQNDESGP